MVTRIILTHGENWNKLIEDEQLSMISYCDICRSHSYCDRSNIKLNHEVPWILEDHWLLHYDQIYTHTEWCSISVIIVKWLLRCNILQMYYDIVMWELRFIPQKDRITMNYLPLSHGLVPQLNKFDSAGNKRHTRVYIYCKSWYHNTWPIL